MGLFDFVKAAGAKIFGGSDDKKGGTAVAPMSKADALMAAIKKHELEVDSLAISVEKETAIVSGKVEAQAIREKVVLVVGNTEGIARVDDRLEVVKPEPEAQFYTVKSGDSLSKIAKQYYKDAMKYPVIFEANRPMLEHPDKIYPGQVLRIPPLDS